jgi:capsular polysaccharide biosynthesis protein
MSAALSMIGWVMGALTVIFVAACTVRGAARVLLLVQVVYWTIAYAARPLVLLWVQPQPRYGDDLADPRLALIGYDHGITEVLRPVVFGLWVYAGLVVAYALWARNRPSPGPVRIDPDLIRTLVAVYVIGNLGRVAALLTGQAASAGQVQSVNPVLDLLSGLGGVGSLGLILFLRLPRARMTALVLGGLLAVELVWAISVQSKSPIMAATLAVAVRFALLGWTRRRTLVAVGLAITGLAGFGWLQSFKLTDEAKAAAAALDAQYPAVVQPFQSVLRRFDLLQAATDAYFMSGRPWLTLDEVLTAGWESLVPTALLGGEKLHSGTAWASQVRGSSVDMTNVSVSLAEGGINEGYVLGGRVGIVLVALFTFGVLLLTVRALHSRHVPVLVLGVLVATSPILDERGFLGSMEVIGKGLQAAVAVWAIHLTLRALRQSPAASHVTDLTTNPAGTRDHGVGEPERNLGIQAMTSTDFGRHRRRAAELGRRPPIIHLLLRRWRVAVAVLAVCVVGALAYAVTAQTAYSATTTMYVSMATGTSVNDSYQGGMAAQMRVTTYSHVAGGTAVAERVVDDLGLDTTPEALQSQISVTFPPATSLLEITATDTTPEGAQLLADAFASQFQQMVAQMETTVVGAAPAAQATVIEPAELPTSPVGRSTTQFVAFGIVLGVALGVLVAFAVDRLDPRVRRPEQLGEVLLAPVVTVSEREPDASRAYARLYRAVTDRPRQPGPTTLVVTSISGRSLPSVGLRLARSLDAAGAKAVLVDTDTSAEGPSAALGLLAERGVADWLASQTTRLDAVLRHTDYGYAIVPLGVADASTVDSLGSERFSALLAELREHYDHIIIATAPSPVNAAALAASWSSAGVVAVGELGKGTLRATREAAEAFADAYVPVVAAVALTPAARSDPRGDRRTAGSGGAGVPEQNRRIRPTSPTGVH